MNRLTTRVEDNVYYSKGKYAPTTLCAEMETWEVRECMKKLAAYEDTGLEPEDISSNIKTLSSELNNAFEELKVYRNLEEQGLLIKLPCKVGTNIFRIVNKRIGRGCNRKFNKTIQPGKAQWDDYDKFGKTAFLTREEAEKALEEMK